MSDPQNTAPVLDEATAVAFLRGKGYKVLDPRQASAGARPTALKADPAEVRAFFDAVGLTRKELADAVGVGIGVIATVQNPLGDRWSQHIFDQRKPLIVAYAVEHKTISAEVGEALLADGILGTPEARAAAEAALAAEPEVKETVVVTEAPGGGRTRRPRGQVMAEMPVAQA